MQYTNYNTINTLEPASGNDRIISVQSEKGWKLFTVKLNNGKTATYSCPWNAKKDDVVIIGNKYSSGKGYEAAPTTGQMGIVTGSVSKSSGAKPSAEIDFVFTAKKGQALLQCCEDYLDHDGDGYDLLYYQNSRAIYPITFYIRQLLCAASVLAHLDECSEESVKKARSLITSKPRLGKKPMNMTRDVSRGIPASLAGYASIDLRSIQIDLNAENEKEIEGVAGCINAHIKRTDAPGGVDCDEIHEYVGKYSCIGAISIMIRGGFTELLNAFLRENPPISSYTNELKAIVGGNGNDHARQVLSDYLANS